MGLLGSAHRPWSASHSSKAFRRQCVLLAQGAPILGRRLRGIVLDLVELADASQRRIHRQRYQRPRFEELPAHVSLIRDVHHVRTGAGPVIASKRIGLEIAAISL
jgi:hypothetical protein